jgi:hypothetical protein
MGVQLVKGYTHLEPLLYLRSLALDSVIYILMGAWHWCARCSPTTSSSVTRC